MDRLSVGSAEAPEGVADSAGCASYAQSAPEESAAQAASEGKNSLKISLSISESYLVFSTGTAGNSADWSPFLIPSKVFSFTTPTSLRFRAEESFRLRKTG